jgi:DNA-binding SARP family transcriptional activator
MRRDGSGTAAPDVQEPQKRVPEGDLEFHVLGPLEMRVGGRALPLGTPKQRAVLAMLLLHRGRAVGIDSLIDAAWEQHAPAGSRATLHSYISNLRRIIRGAGVDAHTVLARVAPGYRLGVPESRCDLGRFVAENNAGVRAAAEGRFEQASGHLSAALAEWRGPALDDLREFGFVEAFATLLNEHKVMAHTAYAEAEIACGRALSVISGLEGLIAEHPCCEPLWAQLITAYYLVERQSDALDAYRRLKVTLVDELGIDPGPTLRTLHERILRQEPLDVPHAAQAAAEDTVIGFERDAALTLGLADATLRDTDGSLHQLASAATRIGRSSDNDIVLSDATVSRHHAVIGDTGNGFVIVDLRSANGVYVSGRRIRSSVGLVDGDKIRVGDHQFIFHSAPSRSTDA